MSASFDIFKHHSCKRPFDGLKRGDKFYFIAMGGVGQSALAKILIKLGYEVSGSDVSESKYLKELKNLGAQVFIGHNANNVPKDCFVILSSAIKEDNPEFIRAKELGLTMLHRSDLLLALTNEFALTIGYAGTHGKTTTSGFCSYLLEKMNTNPAYAIGGIIPELNTNANVSKNSTLFVAELDESDGTIIKYTPEILVINNLEADHPDFYKNGLDDILNTFENMILKQPDDIKIIVNIDDNGVSTLLERLQNTKYFKNIIKFSVENNVQNLKFIPDVIAKNLAFNEVGAEFDVVYKNEIKGRISTSLKGIHNVYNTLAVCVSLIEAGYKFKDFASFVKSFSGMGRRFQTVFKNANLEIIDDYAHHPSEIQSTLNAAAEYKMKSKKDNVIAIFQPHRYSRLKALWNEFLNSFNNCDILVAVDTFAAGDNFDTEFNSKNFIDKFKEKYPSKTAFYIEGKISEIPPVLKSKILDNNKSLKNIILTLGAGDITKLGVLLKDELSKSN